MANVESSRQTISFCGIGAHHQSGVTEHRIRELSELAWTQLLHVMHNSPEIVNKSLWPYTLQHASYLYNQFPRTGKTASPLELFTSSQVRPNLKHLHPFSCPVYVLQASLQNRSKIPRWQECTQLGIYLGHSPYHATSVGLILSLTTSLVSLQFHCIYDDFFATPWLNRHTVSKWQQLSGLDNPQSMAEDSYKDTYQPLDSLLLPFTTPTPDQVFNSLDLKDQRQHDTSRPNPTQGSGRQTAQDGFPLPVTNRATKLPNVVNQTGHLVCNAPVLQVLYRSQALSWSSGKMYCLLS